MDRYRMGLDWGRHDTLDGWITAAFLALGGIIGAA